MEWTSKFTECQTFSSPVVALQKIGGYFKRENGVRTWYPERLMVATRNSIYEWIPDERTVPVMPQREPTKKCKR